MSGPSSGDKASQDSGKVTGLLLQWSDGDHSALDRLIPIIYDDLLRLARAQLNREYRECTLQPHDLVHESYMRLADQTRLEAQNRAHFYAVAAKTMRRVLIDQARRRKADKRGGGMKITLKTGMDFAEEAD
jgi:RNA polymerase sigma factor (TIGR02999 family)